MTANVTLSHTTGFLTNNAAGFSYNFNGAGAPAVGEWDVLYVNSDITLQTPAGFTLLTSFVAQQGFYIFVRKAIGGEAATVTIIASTANPANFNSTLGWARVADADSYDKFVIAQASSLDVTTPLVSSGQLSSSTQVGITYAALHSFAVAPTGITWSAGTTPLGGSTQGVGASGSAGFLGQSTGVIGTAAYTAQATWTNAATDRYIGVVTFTSTIVCPDCPDCPACPDVAPCSITLTGDDPSFTIAEQLLTCVHNAVDHEGALEIKRRCIVPGEIAWDNCECGQLVISENRRFGSRLFPLEEVDHNAECGEPFLVVDLSIALQRCVPGAREGKLAPDCDKLTDAARQLARDKFLMRAAVMCCLTDIYDASGSVLMGFEIGAHETRGPAGGCVGSELNVLLGFANPCGC